MRKSRFVRLVASALAAGLLVGAGALPAQTPAGGASDGRTATEEFIPWVTDFPVTVRPGPPPAERTAAAGISWRDVSIGAGLGIGLAALVAGSALVVRARWHEPRRAAESLPGS